jgi:hypothetical protein
LHWVLCDISQVVSELSLDRLVSHLSKRAVFFFHLLFSLALHFSEVDELGFFAHLLPDWVLLVELLQERLRSILLANNYGFLKSFWVL